MVGKVIQVHHIILLLIYEHNSLRINVFSMDKLGNSSNFIYGEHIPSWLQTQKTDITLHTVVCCRESVYIIDIVKIILTL